MSSPKPPPDAFRPVFVAEDEDDFRSLLTEILTAEGLRVRAFASGAALLVALGDGGEASVLVVDLDLGGAGPEGPELLERLADLPRPPPVLIVSGVGEMAPPARWPPVFDWMAKPVFLPDLVAAVRSLLRGASSRTPRLTDEELADLFRLLT